MTAFHIVDTSAASASASVGPSGFARPYLLVSGIPVYRDPDGRHWIDRLWHHDLLAHLDYIPSLTLAAPCERLGDDTDLVRLDTERLDFVPLPPRSRRRDAILGSPRTALRLWRATRHSDLVHSSVAGWPYPLGWLANLAALAQRKDLLIVVESAPWRGARAGDWRRQAISRASEGMAAFFVRRANLTIFTQPAYRDTLAGRSPRGFTHIAPATWIHDEDILDDEAAQATWDHRAASQPKLLFAGRLCTAKGIRVLLSALERLDSRGVRLEMDLIGDGPLRAKCEAAAEQLDNVRLRVLQPVAYGAPFFDLLSDYHGVVVPSLADEQPRIVFDAFARALPVIGADTDGIASVVDDGETGWLLPSGDDEALADLLAVVHLSAPEARRRGLQAVRWARGRTHSQMHDDRRRLLNDLFG